MSEAVRVVHAQGKPLILMLGPQGQHSCVRLDIRRAPPGYRPRQELTRESECLAGGLLSGHYLFHACTQSQVGGEGAG